MNQLPVEIIHRASGGFMTWFVGIFLLLVSGIGFVAFGPLVRTWSYEPIAGVIVQSKMEYCGMELSGYSEEIRFAYTVGDREYFDGRLRQDFARMCEPKETIAAILERYPEGSTVQGWYDPKRPEVAVITRTPGTMQWVFIAVLGGFLFIFACIWGIQRSNARRQNEI